MQQGGNNRGQPHA
jgi:hypothetical protein